MEPNGLPGCRGCDISHDLTKAILTEKIRNLPLFSRSISQIKGALFGIVNMVEFKLHNRQLKNHLVKTISFLLQNVGSMKRALSSLFIIRHKATGMAFRLKNPWQRVVSLKSSHQKRRQFV